MRGQLLPWVIWGAAASFVFFDCFQQVVPGIIGPSLIESFHVDAAALGTFSAFYFYSYAAMQIPVGVVTDHWGSHRPMMAAALIAAGGSALFAMSGFCRHFADKLFSTPQYRVAVLDTKSCLTLEQTRRYAIWWHRVVHRA